MNFHIFTIKETADSLKALIWLDSSVCMIARFEFLSRLSFRSCAHDGDGLLFVCLFVYLFHHTRYKIRVEKKYISRGYYTAARRYELNSYLQATV